MAKRWLGGRDVDEGPEVEGLGREEIVGDEEIRRLTLGELQAVQRQVQGAMRGADPGTVARLSDSLVRLEGAIQQRSASDGRLSSGALRMAIARDPEGTTAALLDHLDGDAEDRVALVAWALTAHPEDVPLVGARLRAGGRMTPSHRSFLEEQVGRLSPEERQRRSRSYEAEVCGAMEGRGDG